MKEAAKILKIGMNAMYELIKKGEIKVIKRNGSKIRRETLDDFIRSKESSS